jgi:hypothetical protein
MVTSSRKDNPSAQGRVGVGRAGIAEEDGRRGITVAEAGGRETTVGVAGCPAHAHRIRVQSIP